MVRVWWSTAKETGVCGERVAETVVEIYCFCLHAVLVFLTVMDFR